MDSAQTGVRYGTGYGAGHADCTHQYLWPRVLEALAPVPRGSRVLDAGCGNGLFAGRLHELGYDTCGSDLDASGIFHARQRSPQVRFEVGSVYDDLAQTFEGPFDAVVSLEVIEHLFEPRRFLAAAHEALKPGGRLVLSTPYHGYLKNLTVALAGKFDRHVSPDWDGGHIKFWSRQTLTKVLEEQGFRVVQFLGAGRFPYLWKSMVLAAVRD